MDGAFQCSLPYELLALILEDVAKDKTFLYKSLATLRSCRLVCSTLNEIAIPQLYHHIPFNGPHPFAKVNSQSRHLS